MSGLAAATHASDDYAWGLVLGWGLFGGVPLSATGFVMATAYYIFGFKKYQPLIAHLQCSQVPVRHEPDADGEINYPFVFAEIDRLGYQHWIGAEYIPRGRTEDGLGWAKPYGVVPK